MNVSEYISPYWHYFFDLLAYGFGARSIALNFKTISSKPGSVYDDPWYWRSLTIGAVIGAILVGSSESFFNANTDNFLAWIKSIHLGHSISGALFGGVVSVEIYKMKSKKIGSTGFIFVLPLLGGTFIGRWGCFLSGVADNTYGVESSGFGIDIGDGINRHPVALYESLVCLFLFFTFKFWSQRSPKTFQNFAFYLYTLSYSLQRFFWEFLKPYPKVKGLPINVFQTIAIVMMVYSIWMIKGVQRESRQRDGARAELI